MGEEFPFDINPMYEGERIRKKGMYVELGGPDQPGFELVRAASMDEVEDGRFTMIGPDILDLKEGSQNTYAMMFRMAGELVETDLESVVERRMHDFQNYIQGYMHLNQRYDIWVRVSKDAVKKGLKSFEQIAKATIRLYKAELPFIEKMEATFITDPDEVKKQLDGAMEIFAQRDARTRDLHDEDVDLFYGCTLCQSFAPTNVCVVTPDRVSLCGAINWFDGRAAANVDPEGPNFAIEKGECIDEIGGEYTGVNEKTVELSGGEYDRIQLHSFFDAPHTSCGCFEVIGFYMPEVDGIGWVDRDYTEPSPNGLAFSTMAGNTGGGKQSIGFLGIGVEYFRSPKFIQKDGGWNRVVWMPSRLKERVKDGIPADISDKISTENDTKTIDELKEFLKAKDHPVVKNWIEEVEEAEEEAAAVSTAGGMGMPMQMQQFAPGQIMMPAMGGGSGGGIKIILKNAKITISEVKFEEAEGSKKKGK